MRVRTLEIRWHDSKPISTCDFQPVPFKKARPTQDKNFVGQSYKLATGGEDNHVRVSLTVICLLSVITEEKPLCKAVACPPEHHAAICARRCGRRDDHTASIEGRIPRNSQQTLGGSQRSAVQSQRYVFMRVFVNSEVNVIQGN